MNYIIAIVGPSGSGKTTISRAMAEAGIPDIVSYTTRPIREGETDGVEHRFITHQEAISMIENHAIAAYTEFGDHLYFATVDQLSEHPYCTYVIDECGLDMLHAASGDDLYVIPVFVTRSAEAIHASIDMQRRQRDEHRSWYARDYYDVIIHNDATDLQTLREWAFRFALSVLSVLPVRKGLHRCELHTSDTHISNIINKINNVRSAL